MLQALGLTSDLPEHIAKQDMFGNCPTTLVEIGDVDVEAIVDTGATANFISKDILDSLSQDMYKRYSLDEKLPILTAASHRVYVSEIIELDCIIESELVKVFFFLAPWLVKGLILGVPFKEQFRDLALTIISREVPLFTTEKYIEIISAVEARRSLQATSTVAKLLFIRTEEELPGESGNSDLAQEVFDQNADVIVDDLPNQPTPHRTIVHTIDLIPGHAPPAKRPYRLSAKEKLEVEAQIEALLAAGRIEARTSPFAAPILLVKKKDGTKRMCCDYRGLNDITVKSKYPLPLIDDLLDMLAGATTFSQLDLVSGYHQVEVKPEDQNKTAFVTPQGQYIWKVMPFGLTNAPSTFQLLMNDTLKDIVGKFVLVYLDDILIFSKSVKEHKMHIKIVLDRIRKAKLFAKKKKCHFFKDTVYFLGHKIDKDGIHVDESKVEAMTNWPVPTKPLHAASFLGTAGFYRKFIDKFSSIALPLMEYSNSKKQWDNECLQAFNALKQKLATAPVLLPFDETAELVVTTDASDFAIGATLEMLTETGSVKGVVAYMSSKLSGSQLNWDVREKEGYAVQQALRRWEHYLRGKPFTLNTDHESLKYLHTQRNQKRKIARWLDLFADFEFEIVYIPGPRNRADGLSRIPTEAEELPELALVATLQGASSAVTLSAVTPEYVDQLKEGYLTDPVFKEIYEILKNGLEVPPSLRTIIKRYEIKDSLLYYGFSEKVRFKLCIPNTKVRDLVLRHGHDSPAASHCDALRTFLNLTNYYHWPRMRRTVTKYVQACQQCQFSKAKTGNPPGVYTPLEVADDRWRRINIDFISGFEADKYTGNDQIMVVIDQLSKMAHFVAMKKTITSAELCDVFMREVVRLHGSPQVIVSDRDKLFTAAVWDRFTQRLGIKLSRTTSHNPQADGQVERANRILVERMRAVCDTQVRKWEAYLPMVEFAYNNSFQSSIRATPFLAAYAFHPRYVGLLNPIQPSDSDPMARQVESAGAKAQLDRTLKVSSAILEDIRRTVAEEQERVSMKNNKRLTPQEFKVGDRVLLHSSAFAQANKGRKFNFLWYGPFPVVEKISDNNYRLALRAKTTKHDVFNVKVLKTFHERLNDYGRVPPLDDDIPMNLHLITQFGEMTVKDGQQIVETFWKDCEKWDTRPVPMSTLEAGLPADFINYLKGSRNRRQQKQSSAYKKIRPKLPSCSKRKFPKRGGKF